jgi:type I restriction enzyme M protein
VATKSKGKNNGDGETISNANSLWIQYFYSYLNDTGRAGFVMASSASDAGNKDKEIRQKLIETGHVDVMMSIGPKFFYTRSLPCALWFFDKGKPEDLLDTVLMIDARNVYTVVSARSHVFTDEQLANLTAITWLYRGEHEKFVALLASYHQNLAKYLTELQSRLAADGEQITKLAKVLSDFAKATTDAAALAAVREKLGEEHGITDDLLQAFRDEAQKPAAQTDAWQQALDAAQAEASKLLKALAKLDDDSTFDQRKAVQTKAESINPALKAGLAALESRHKAWLKLLDLAEKTLRPRQWAAFDGDGARDTKRSLQPRDVKKREKPTVRDLGVEALKRAGYFIAQGNWLVSRFPSGLYADVLGLCKAVSRAEIQGKEYSLTPGREVGSAIGVREGEDGDAFVSRMREIHSELVELNAASALLAAKVQGAFAEIIE